MKIPMVDLKKQYLSLQSSLDERILNWLSSGQFILGPEGKMLEEEMAHYLNVKCALGLASGTDALILALRALDIKVGDEVITTPFTFMASASAILLVGATPIFVDIDPRTFNIDPKKIKDAITPKTRAILPVHLFGQSADMTAIMAIAEQHQLRMIEDCAQSIGGTWQNKMTGSFGDIGAFSFYPSKNLGCYGDGGLISTNNESVAEKMMMLRNHGSNVRYHHDILGYNSRLDEVQAIILRVKLPHLEEYNQKRYQVAQHYHHYLKDLPLTLPFEHPLAKHVYHQYTILSEKRDSIAKTLTEAGVGNAIYYPIALHKQKLFENQYQSLSLPNSEKAANQCLSLPIFPEMTEEQVKQVAQVIQQSLVTCHA